MQQDAYAERIFSVCGELTTGKPNRTSRNLIRMASFFASELQVIAGLAILRTLHGAAVLCRLQASVYSQTM